jgi:hypothetical protein
MYDAGKIVLGLAAFGALATGPVWWALGSGRGAPPDLQRPVDAKQCIEPTAFMRARHMELLDGWRDAVVREDRRVYVASDGKEHRMSLTGTCLRCHAEPRKFCDRCHEYAGVSAYCWDCHREPRKTLAAAGAAGSVP